MLKQLSANRTLSAHNEISIGSTKISFSSRQLTERAEGKIERSIFTMKKMIRNQLENKTSIFKSYSPRMNQAVGKKNHSESNQLMSFESIINALNPENVLKRGYSITLHKGKLISITTPLKEGDLLLTKTEGLTISSTWVKTEVNN